VLLKEKVGHVKLENTTDHKAQRLLLYTYLVDGGKHKNVNLLEGARRASVCARKAL
jgi:hypothetical protein